MKRDWWAIASGIYVVTIVAAVVIAAHYWAV